jgi:hypothetical protein
MVEGRGGATEAAEMQEEEEEEGEGGGRGWGEEEEEEAGARGKSDGKRIGFKGGVAAFVNECCSASEVVEGADDALATAALPFVLEEVEGGRWQRQQTLHVS